MKPVLMQMGMSSNTADLLLEMADALNSGHMKMLEPRSPANTTPTTLETFVAEVFLPAYREKAYRVRHRVESFLAMKTPEANDRMRARSC